MLEVDVGPLELRLVLVGWIDIGDRPLARPLNRQHEHADEGRRIRFGGSGEDRVRPSLVPPLERAVLVRLALRLDADAPSKQYAQAWAGVCVEVRDAARREVDSIAADHRRPRRTLDQLPHECMAFDVSCAEVRLVALYVVDDAIAVLGRRAVGMLGQMDDQWK